MNNLINSLARNKLSQFDKEVCLKYQALSNLFFFETDILGYNKLVPENQEWCWDLENMLDNGILRSLSLAPRITFKTTVRTKGYALWRLAKKPNIRILIISETENNAKKYLREIKGHCERNKKFRYYFGDWVVSDKWAETEIVIAPRTENYAEASITAMGFGATLTSAHYDIIIIDDPVGRKDRESDTIRKKKIDWFREIPSILNDMSSEIHIIGTRWHNDDLYHFIMNTLNDELKTEKKQPYNVTCQEAKTDKGKSNFPNIYSVEDLKAKEIEVGVVLFACNYQNRPLTEGSEIFKLEDLQFYNHLKFEQEFIKTKKHLSWHGFIDPSLGKSSSDYVCIITGAVPTNGYIYIEECKLVLVPPSKQTRLIADLQDRYRYKSFGIEENMFQGLLKKEIADLSAQEKTYIKLKRVYQTKNKQVRIETAEPQIKRYVRFRDDWKTAYPKLIHQLIHFPVTTHDDGPDALEGLLSLIKRPRKQIFLG